MQIKLIMILVNIFIQLVCEILPHESILGFCYFWRIITLSQSLSQFFTVLINIIQGSLLSAVSFALICRA